MLGHIRSRISGARGWRAAQPPALAEAAPFDGYTSNLNRIKFVDSLGDDDLAELNNLLEWRCFVADALGRRFGDIAWQGKRCEPQPVPDPRIALLDERFHLSDKRVLEIGCFEGVHTVGLSLFARRVTAVDSRIENVVKTIVRCAFFGCHPTVFKCDVEARPLDIETLAADVVHHVGVLYHLRDPVRHLLDLKDLARVGVMLDTHYAEDHEAVETYETAGRPFSYKSYPEQGYADPFSGMYDHSKWLQLGDIVALLQEAGFGQVEVVETRAERNGPRALLLARRS